MPASVGIIVPAYKPDISQLSQYIYAMRDQVDPEQIIIEIDEASQETSSQLNNLPAKVNHHPSRRGKGAAISAGFEKLETDILAFADADGSTPADEFNRIIRSVDIGSSDLAIGSRRHPDSDVRSNQTIARRYMGDVFAHLARSLLNADLYDFQCGAKAVSKDSWIQLRSELYEPGFAWDLELIAMAENINLLIEEIPIQWHDKPHSTVDPVRTTTDMMRALLLIHHRIRLSQDSVFHQKVSDIYTDSRSPLMKSI
jgi:glycosyltransferase involved in cell wall biosynthesis